MKQGQDFIISSKADYRGFVIFETNIGFIAVIGIDWPLLKTLGEATDFIDEYYKTKRN